MRSLLLVSLIPVLFGCDHATKLLVKKHLEDRPALALVDGWLDLRYTENRDTAFNALRAIPTEARRPLILIGNGLVLALLVWLGLRGGPAASPLGRLGLALAIAGGLGNMVDRLVRGYVVDFIHVHFWPVFNVADICITIGTGLLIIAVWRPPAASRKRRA